MPSDDDAANDSFDGTPFRALLAGGASYDVTLGERGDALTLRPTPEEDEEAAPAERARYRFERTGERGHALLVIDGRSVPVVVADAGAGEVRVTIAGRTETVQVKDETDLLLERFGIADAAGTSEAEVRAPMPGLVVRVLVAEGQDVKAGDGLLVLEAMKMENELSAPVAGTVTALHAAEGDSVGKGDVLAEVEAS